MIPPWMNEISRGRVNTLYVKFSGGRVDISAFPEGRRELVKISREYLMKIYF